MCLSFAHSVPKRFKHLSNKIRDTSPIFSTHKFNRRMLAQHLHFVQLKHIHFILEFFRIRWNDFQFNFWCTIFINFWPFLHRFFWRWSQSMYFGGKLSIFIFKFLWFVVQTNTCFWAFEKIQDKIKAKIFSSIKNLKIEGAKRFCNNFIKFYRDVFILLALEWSVLLIRNWWRIKRAKWHTSTKPGKHTPSMFISKTESKSTHSS